ncbi:MAG TPA: universal stress protein [Chloroflexota bacterium]
MTEVAPRIAPPVALPSYTLLLLGSDGSAAAHEATRHALAVASRTGATLEIVYVVETGLPLPGGVSAWERIGRRHLADLERLARRYGVTARGAVLSGGSAGQVLVAEAEAVGADLVVVGSRSLSLAERLVERLVVGLGSTAQHVVSYARCPALVVPLRVVEEPTGEPPAYARLLHATDGSPQARQAALHAIYLAHRFGAALHVVSLVETAPLVPPAEHRRAAAEMAVREAIEWARAHGVRADGEVIAVTRVAQTIERLARERGVDLIVVGTRGLTAARQVLEQVLTGVGSVTNHLIQHAPCPVLAVRSPYQPPASTGAP